MTYVPSVVDGTWWDCDRCLRRYRWTDELPHVEDREDRIEVTTFGDPKRSWLVSKVIELTCEDCEA